MRQIVKTCAHCQELFNATCGKASYCSDLCHIKASYRVAKSGCWEWTAGFDKDGYGVVRMRGRRRYKAHRAAWMLFRGELPPKALVCHSCDNPKCINPNHLFLGSAADNKHDCISKDRHVRGERLHWKAKLTAADVTAIRKDDRNSYILADEYGVSAVNIQLIKKRRIWKHIP